MKDAETARLPAAQTELAAVANRYDEVVRRGSAIVAADRLWRHAVADVQAGHLDDRPLYWGRLKLRRRAGARGTEVERPSRGLPLAWPGGQNTLLLTGFDPFHLDRDLGQSNPSGLAVLALHGTRIGGVLVVGAILPVRFADFDAGLVEAALEGPFRRGPLLGITVSMGRDGFDLERFPGRRRSAATLDNANAAGGGSPAHPRVPPGLAGPEFLEFSLPAAAMANTPGRWPVRDNRRVATLAGGSITAASPTDLHDQVAVAGSPGGYLSNEVAYRSLLLQQRLGVSFPLGHVHVPALTGHDAGVEGAIVCQLRAIVAAAVAGVTGSSMRVRLGTHGDSLDPGPRAVPYT